MPSFWPLAWKMFGCSTTLLRFMYSTNPRTPPANENSSSFPARWSTSTMRTPLLRNESSRSRLARMS